MRKPVFAYAKTKIDCFCYKESAIPLLSLSKISGLWPSSVAVQPGLFQTWPETLKTGFLATRLNY